MESAMELPVPSKRMRVEGPRSASGYNVFCKEISADEDMKALSPKERFKAFAERWASLEEEDREDFARRAAALELSEADKDKKWRANMKKMVQLINIQKELKPSTEGFFILSTGVAGEEQAGGTPGGKRFLQQTEVVEGFRSSQNVWTPPPPTIPEKISVCQIRKLFNAKYASAVGKEHTKMPYTTTSPQTVAMEGLPDGLSLRPPSRYGNRQLRQIWEVRDNLKCSLINQHQE